MKDTDVKELVRAVAREVLRQLKDLEPAKDCVLVLARRDQAVAEKVRSLVGGEYEYFFFGDELHDRTPCRYILPSLSCTAMAELSFGGASGPLPQKVLELLLLGREVEVLEYEYQAHADTAPGPLFDLYRSQAETLAGFGLRAFKPEPPDTVRFRENLVTASVVDKAAGAKVLMVPERAVVTPLARETAETANMDIRKCL